MPRAPDEDLTKVTLNLYTSDIHWIRSTLNTDDEGWSVVVRAIVRAHVLTQRRGRVARTLEELDAEINATRLSTLSAPTSERVGSPNEQGTRPAHP